MNHRIPDLVAFLGGGSPQPESADRRGIPEAQIERLREVQLRYAQPCDFTPGDIVTPRTDASMVGERQAFIVLEVIAKAWPMFNTLPYGSDKRFDLRLAYVHRDGRILTVWAESFEMEPWSPTPAPSVHTVPHPSAPAEAGFGAAA